MEITITNKLETTSAKGRKRPSGKKGRFRGNDNSPEGKILKMLEGRDFEDWYKEDFMDYISGEEGAEDREGILSALRDML